MIKSSYLVYIFSTYYFFSEVINYKILCYHLITVIFITSKAAYDIYSINKQLG